MLKFIKPEFFDIFGIIVFSFIVFVSFQSFQSGDVIPRWAILSLLVIGVLGLIVDGTIVYKTYLKRESKKNI